MTRHAPTPSALAPAAIAGAAPRRGLLTRRPHGTPGDIAIRAAAPVPVDRARLWRRLLAVTLVAAVAAGCTSGGAEGDDQQAGQVVQFAAEKRVAAPEVKGELLEGGSFDLAAHKGKVVVLNFWASWCAPCRIEVADLEAVHQELSEVEFVGLNTYDDRDKALAFIENKATYPSILDTSGKLAMGFRQVPPNTLPATIIIDTDGKIAVVIRRTTTKDELKQLVSTVVAERG